MNRLTCLFIILLILSACTSLETKTHTSQINDTTKTETAKQSESNSSIDTIIKLDFFEAVPDTIDGCGEYFTYDTSKFTNQKFIFLSNITDFAIIKISGKEIYLQRVDIESKEINEKSYMAVYKGQGYKAVLIIKQTKTYDEGGFYSGTLQIISDKISATYKVHGEAGC